MPEKITTKISKLFVWVLVALIALSFAAWGVGDIFRGRSGNIVATAGNVKITLSEYQNAVCEEQQKFQAMMRGNVLPEVIKQEIEKQTLNSLIRQKLLEQSIQDMGFRISQEQLVKIIASNPQFQNEKGRFDPALFSAALNKVGKTEGAYLGALEKDAAFHLLFQSLFAEKSQPNIKAVNLYQATEQKRVIELITLSAASIKNVPAATDEEIAGFYSQKKSLFTLPEKRDISYLILEAKNAPSYDVKEEDIAQEYDKRKASLQLPETRDIENVIVKDKAEAEAFIAEVKQGKDFRELAKNKTLGEKESTSLKQVRKTDLSPDSLAENAYKLGLNGISEPIESPFGWHVIKVTAINPSRAIAFEEVKADIKRELEEQHARNAFSKFVTQVEDEVASGAAFEEIGKKFNLNVERVSNLTAQPKQQKTGSIAGLPSFIEAAFATPDQSDSNMISTPDNQRYFILHVDKVTPAAAEPLEQVKSEVEQAWKQEKQQELAKSKAEKLAKALQEKGPEELKGEEGVTVKTLPAMQQQELQKMLPRNIAGKIFSLKANEYSNAEAVADGSYVIAGVKDIISDKTKDAAKLEQLRQQLVQEGTDDMLAQFIAHLQRQYPVKIEKAAQRSSQE